eukprot:1351883-Rhodomonas_salina.2
MAVPVVQHAHHAGKLCACKAPQEEFKNESCDLQALDMDNFFPKEPENHEEKQEYCGRARGIPIPEEPQFTVGSDVMNHCVGD